MAEKAAKPVKNPRVAMPEQDPQVRARNFLEVPTGYTNKMAQEEAARCLQCKKPACVAGCPVEVDIPGFIELISQGDITGSIRNLWSKNALPAVCGRVCWPTLCYGQATRWTWHPRCGRYTSAASPSLRQPTRRKKGEPSERASPRVRPF